MDGAARKWAANFPCNFPSQRPGRPRIQLWLRPNTRNLCIYQRTRQMTSRRVIPCLLVTYVAPGCMSS